MLLFGLVVISVVCVSLNVTILIFFHRKKEKTSYPMQAVVLLCNDVDDNVASDMLLQDQRLNDMSQQVLELQSKHSLATATIEELRSQVCLLYTSPSPRDINSSRMPSSA